MKKSIVQLLIVAGLFTALFFGLSKIDWMTLFKVKEKTKTTEEKLGKLFLETFTNGEVEIHSKTINSGIDTLVSYVCLKNGIDKSGIKIHVIEKDEINAFALPDNHMVVYTGLIRASENQEELIGVISHEIAHMEKNHIMKKLTKEIGLSVLISMATGRGNNEAIQKAARLLSSSAYDRTLESEADMTAVEYLLKADIDPEPFANFLFRLSTEDKDIPNQVYWISTHPESKERAETIIEYLKDMQYKKKAILTEKQWQAIKDKLKDSN